MSYSIYYTIHINKKTYHYIDTMFFGKQLVYDYKRVCDKIFDSYTEAINFINENYDFYKYHVRKNISTSGSFSTKDYIYRYKRRFYL